MSKQPIPLQPIDIEALSAFYKILREQVHVENSGSGVQNGA